MLNALLTAGLAAAIAGQPYIDQENPLRSDFDISAMRIDAAVEQLPDGLYEYVYTFESPPLNRAETRSLRIDLSCPQAVSPALFLDTSAIAPQHRYLTGQDVPYVPVREVWGENKSTPVITTPDGESLITIIARPGGRETVRMRSAGAPMPRNFTLVPQVDYQRLDWEAHPGLDGETLPYERDFEIRGVMTGPGCSTEPASGAPRLAGVNPIPEFESVNDVLTFDAPLRNRAHLARGETDVSLRVHYSELLDPATFETCPATLRKHFTPVPGTTETVRLPINANRVFVTLAARGRGEPPVQPKHNVATLSPIDTDLFEFRRDDLPYEPKPIECRLYERVPQALARFPAPPPAKYDGRPLVRAGSVSRGPITAIRGQRYAVTFLLSEQADPDSVSITVDGEDVTAQADIDPHFATVMLPSKLGERHVVIEARAKPEVVGAPAEPTRVEYRQVFKGMEVELRAEAIRISPDGKQTTRDVKLLKTEIDPQTGEPVKTKDEP